MGNKFHYLIESVNQHLSLFQVTAERKRECWMWTTSLLHIPHRRCWLRAATCPRGCCAPAAMEKTTTRTVAARTTRPCRDADAVPSPTTATCANVFTCATCHSEQPSRLFSLTKVISSILPWIETQLQPRAMWRGCLVFVLLKTFLIRLFCALFTPAFFFCKVRT